MSPIPVRPASLMHSTLGDEVVVYHTETSEAHTLKGEVARVWLACDRSGLSIETIANELGMPAETVEAIVVSLIELRLLDDARGPSRRVFLRGGAVVGGTMVASVLLPEAVAHASTTTDTGKLQTNNTGSYPLPASTHAVTITIAGAQGGSAVGSSAGTGAVVTWTPTDALVAGQTLSYTLGRAGVNGTATAAGAGGSGAPRGGNGATNGNSTVGSGGGGGATSAVLTGTPSSTTVIAGGGGGGGSAGNANSGGNGGAAGAVGTTGSNGGATLPNVGGTGGAGGTAATAGTAGGDAASSQNGNRGTGGGGGGGGGVQGGNPATNGPGGGGGGGGGCQVTANATVTATNNTGDGYFRLIYTF